MIRMPQTVYQPKETATFEVLAAAPTVEVTDSEGKLQKVTVKSKSGHVKEVSCMLPSVGLYTVKVTDGDKQSQGVLSAHASWEWTMERAREGALKYHQKATSHIESWYGFHSSFIAARYFPENNWMRLCAVVLIICSGCCTTGQRWCRYIMPHVFRIHREQ